MSNPDSNNSLVGVPSTQTIAKPKRLLLVTIIFWITFLRGIVTLALVPLTFFLAITVGASFADSYFMILPVILGLFYIILSFGLRAMKRWALYAFTILAILGLISAVFINSKLGLINAVLGVGMTVYLLSISKKFV
ncbi:MAG: hypothetical protein HYT47_01595 [Candidatus Vogelbacteria bacterium]|nr:hypothetical protein [Candidatus Vogelbacteria bacterium]